MTTSSLCRGGIAIFIPQEIQKLKIKLSSYAEECFGNRDNPRYRDLPAARLQDPTDHQDGFRQTSIRACRALNPQHTCTAFELNGHRPQHRPQHRPRFGSKLPAMCKFIRIGNPLVIDHAHNQVDFWPEYPYARYMVAGFACC